MVERIKEIILKEGLTSGSFADAIGVQRSSVSHLLNGRNKPSLDFILKTLEAFPYINTEWLLLGKGSMTEVSARSVEKPHVNQPSIFSTLPDDAPVVPPVLTDKPPVKEAIRASFDEKQVDRIVIFYSDMTFDTYNPA